MRGRCAWLTPGSRWTLHRIRPAGADDTLLRWSALAQDLRQAHGLPVKLMPVERDKESRLYVHQAKFEAGLVHFPKEAPFMADLLAELLAFPPGKTDDQVDSISQALSYKRGYGWTTESLEGFCQFYEMLLFNRALGGY